MSVHRFTDGRKGWYFQFRVNGKKVKKERWRGHKMLSKAEALQCQQECWEELNDIRPALTLYELYDDFLNNSKSNLKKSAMSHYMTFKRVYLPLLPNKIIYDFKVKDVQDFKSKVVAMKTTTIQTKNRFLNIFKNVLDYGSLIYELSSKLQLPLIEPLKDHSPVITQKEKWLPEEKFRMMLTYLDLTNDSHFYYYVVINVLYYTGLRIGELAALTLNDYNNGIIRITKDYVRVNGEDIVQSPKTKNSIRNVYVDDITQELIEHYIRKYKPEGNLFHRESPFLNQQKLRSILTALAVDSRLNNQCEIPPHTLRHSHASNLRELGYDEFSIAHRLGNTPKVSASTYIHSSDSEQIEMIERLRK